MSTRVAHEDVAVHVDHAGEVQVVRIVAVGNRRNYDALVRDKLGRAFADGSGQKHVHVQRQVRAVIFDASRRQQSYSLLRRRFFDLRPRHLAVLVLRRHTLASPLLVAVRVMIKSSLFSFDYRLRGV